MSAHASSRRRPPLSSVDAALAACAWCLIFLLVAIGAAAAARAAPSPCVPRGAKEPTYAWDPLHIEQLPDGREVPTERSLERLQKHQTGQIALDPVRNVEVAFISGVTLEAPAGTKNWTVVQTATCPPARWAGALAYDPVNGEMVLWGGTMSIEGPTDELWLYDTTRRDWRRFEGGSDAIRDLRRRVTAARDALETLRWDAWKTLEWAVTDRTGALPVSVLAERLQTLLSDLAVAMDAAAQAESDLDGYERMQAAGVQTWLRTGREKLAAADAGLRAGSPEDLERSYRTLVSALADLLSAADSIRAAPPPRYFVTLTYDPSRQALVLGRSVGKPFPDEWIYRLPERRWERVDPPPGSPVHVPQPEGEFVLRDAPSAAELREYREKTRSWAENIPPNTWVVAPSNGPGRPNWGRTWSSIVYDPDREQLYYRDGGHGSYHGNITDHYDIRTGRWFRSDVEEVPDSRIMGTYFGWGRGYNYAPWAIHTYKWQLFYNPLTRHLQRGVFYTPNRLPPGSVHDYDPDRGRWSKDPAIVTRTGVVVPGTTDGIVSVHAWERYSGLPSATVTYETASGVKQRTDTGPIPFHGANRDDDFAFVFDPPRNRVLYYGGQGDALGLFALDLDDARPRWRKLEAFTADGGPLPPAFREWIYVARHDRFLTMEWQGSGHVGPPKVWSYDPETNEFRRVDLALGDGVKVGEGADHLRPVSPAAGLAYDPVSDIAFYIKAANRPPRMFAFRYVP